MPYLLDKQTIKVVMKSALIFSVMILSLVLITAPVFVSAQTSGSTTTVIEALQKQIQDLLKQLQTLQQQVVTLQTELGVSPSPTTESSAISTATEPETASIPELTRSLSLGTRGDDVRSLQEFLARDKEIYPEGLATGFFGPRTQAAVKKWQQKYGVEAIGIVGPKTIEKFKELGRGVIQGLIQQGAGRSGVKPSGLDIAPGIQKQIATTTPIISTATTTLPTLSSATTTPTTTATTTPSETISAVPAIPATPAIPGVTSAVPATPAIPATPVVASNELKVTYPNGGETWYKDNAYTITWQNPLASGFTGKEKYYWNVLLKRGNTAWQADGGVPVTQSSYTWSKWTGWPEPIPNAADFKVGISLVDTCAAQVGGSCPSANISITPAGGIDYSDNYFTATSTPPTIVTTDTTVPSVPANLTATPPLAATAASSYVNLYWTSATDNVGVVGYKIYRGGTLLISVPSTYIGTVSYTDSGLSASTVYSYSVATYDAAGNVSAQSLPVTITTAAADTTPPSAPTNLQVALNGNTNQSPTRGYYLAFNYTLQSNIQSFNIYEKKPTDPDFVKYTYNGQIPVNPSILPLLTAGEAPKLYRRGETNWERWTSVLAPSSSLALGEYKFYVTAVNTNNVESANTPTVSFKLYSAPTITSPANGSTVSISPTITFTPDPLISGQNHSFFLYKQTTSYIWSTANVSGTSVVYNGPLLNPADNPHRLVISSNSGPYIFSDYGVSAFNVSTTTTTSAIANPSLASIIETLNEIIQKVKILIK